MQADELKDLKEQIDAHEAELKRLQAQETQQVAAGKRIHQEVKRLEAALEAIALKQSEIVKTAQLEQVRNLDIQYILDLLAPCHARRATL